MLPRLFVISFQFRVALYNESTHLDISFFFFVKIWEIGTNFIGTISQKNLQFLTPAWFRIWHCNWDLTRECSEIAFFKLQEVVKTCVNSKGAPTDRH